ncbi:hypothetical protein BamMEX5DRAFT_4329 [Burkholderia ambifaria MEX-5]|uniref:Uncharacterized protein n=1 Tax=Burkholderia ambifaria MEX-5 TaxID=396597 RepID=B1T963_9BURK|nr:hypothetical protein BamMEX5DRAFT_4329 [Burkholderia ambifaria MEX-5]
MGSGCGSKSKGLTVAHTMLVATFRYREVVARLRCPISNWILRTSVPASSRWVAKAWRNECGVIGFWIPLRWRAIRHANPTADRLMGCPGISPGNSHSLGWVSCQ